MSGVGFMYMFSIINRLYPDSIARIDRVKKFVSKKAQRGDDDEKLFRV
jgi:hypothetical protein